MVIIVEDTYFETNNKQTLHNNQTGKDQDSLFVCGAGHQGLSMAAHLALSGIKVNLWNRNPDHIKKIIDTHIIHCSGVISGDAIISRASSKIEDTVDDLVMVTTPSTAHRDIAKELAPYVHRNMVIILNPGRTFGAIEFAEELKNCGVKELPHIAETQTIVYTCRKTGDNSARIYALKKNVGIAAIRGCSIDYILSRLPTCLRNLFVKYDSVALTSFSNVGMILHCAPVMMNIGWIESEKVAFKYYYDGISRSVASYLEKMDQERIAVAKACGFKIESVREWLYRCYAVSGDTLYDCIRNNVAYKEIDAPPTIFTRYIYEDVPNGLVPVETMGIEYGIRTPNISTIINLACSVMDTDYRAIGRRFTSEQLKKYL